MLLALTTSIDLALYEHTELHTKTPTSSRRYPQTVHTCYLPNGALRIRLEVIGHKAQDKTGLAYASIPKKHHLDLTGLRVTG